MQPPCFFIQTVEKKNVPKNTYVVTVHTIIQMDSKDHNRYIEKHIVYGQTKKTCRVRMIKYTDPEPITHTVIV